MSKGVIDIQEAAPWLEAETPPGWRVNQEGVFRVPDDPEKDPVLVSGPVWVAGLTRDENGSDWGVLVRWIDLDRELRKWAMPRARLHDQGAGVAQDLARGGLFVAPGRERDLARYLGSARPERRFRCVTRLGWVDTTDGRLLFVLPHEVIGTRVGEAEEVVFQAEKYAPTHAFRAEGDLAAWREAVAKPCGDHPALVFALCWALAAPLLKPAGIGGAGAHFFGASSTGKTTLAQVAASVWGCGADPAAAPELSMVRTWRTTANALEGIAATHCDTLLPLDELGLCAASDVGAVVYELAGGAGKARMSDSARLQKTRTWRTLFLSTGEISIRQKIEERGRMAHAGQLVRALDIPAEAGIIRAPNGAAPREIADRLKAAAGTFYGTAGPELVRRLVAETKEFGTLRGEVRTILDLLARDLTPAQARPDQARAVRLLALAGTAGFLAQELGVLPWDNEVIVGALRFVLDAWTDVAPHLSDAARGVERVREFILRHRARFQALADPSADVPRDRAGFVTADGDFLILPSAFAEAVGDLDHRAVARELLARQLLKVDQSDRLVSKAPRSADAGRPPVYWVRAALLEEEGDAP
ncbi:DUF927 domain-containing protein [Deferrisoma camini]|uniref:DUF927 domain-containing protein n=1 Tax=Deferrisoma camini TaxID=1035120 RepID=UPI00046CF4E8|nr:DUF927 domain-containing protein [Deferrisoma camini]